MDLNEIKKLVHEAISAHAWFSVAEIEDGHLLKDDFGIDSLDVVEMVMTFEEKLSIHVSDEETSEIERMTVGQLVGFLAEKVNV